MRESGTPPSTAVRLASIAVALVATLAIVELLLMLVPIRNVGPAFTKFDPVYFTVNKPNMHFRSRSAEFEMDWTTNSLGFRGPEPAQPSEGVVLALGDSFTQGYGVTDGKEWAALVRDRLGRDFGPGRVQLLNAGIGNTGHGRWVKFLEREAPKYSPRVVVLQLAGNDYEENVRDALYKVGPDGELIEQPLAVTRERRLQSAIETVPGLAYSRLVALLRQAMFVFTRPVLDGETPEARRAREAVEDRLANSINERILAICYERRWPLVVLIAPFYAHRVAPVRTMFEARGVPVIVAPTKIDRPDLYYKIDGHWNTAGNAVVADMIYPSIKATIGEEIGKKSEK
jgi:lysophospholipase L1-like esterase